MGKRTPWYKWQLRLTGILLVLFFAWAAWHVFWDVEFPTRTRVVMGGVWAFVAAWLALQEWRYRKPQNMWPPEEKDQPEE